MKVVKENIEQLKIKFKENYKDDPYMKDSDGIRVHKNNGLEVGNLIAIIVCRGYDDYLNLTLKRTMEEFSRVIVITSTKDLATKDIVEKYGAELFTTTILDSDDFKKGTSINECLKTLPKDSWVIVCDADIIFQKGFGTRISNLILNPGALYYVTRIGPQMIEWKVSRHIAQLALKTDDWGLIEETIGIKGNYPVGPWGYTQIFNLSSSIFKEHQEEYYPSNSNDAELDDSEIAIKWFKTSRCVYLNDKKYYVLHLPHGYNKINWKGRISPRLDDDHWWINDNTECLWHRSFRSGPQYLGLTEMCEWLKLPEDSVVIEIGTMMGDSSLIFGHEFKNHRIITVDPGPTPVMVAEAKKRTALLPNIERWEMYSEDAVKKVIEEKIKVGMVYIDGDHSYDAVKKDIRLWRQLSSIICGHDYGIPRWQGVTDAVHSEIGAPIKVFRDSSWVGIQS